MLASYGASSNHTSTPSPPLSSLSRNSSYSAQKRAPPPLSPSSTSSFHDQWPDRSDSPPMSPISPTRSQQVYNLIEYVVDAICFGHQKVEFDMDFKVASPVTQHVFGKEQADRIEARFGPKMRSKQEVRRPEQQQPPPQTQPHKHTPAMQQQQPLQAATQPLRQTALSSPIERDSALSHFYDNTAGLGCTPADLERTIENLMSMRTAEERSQAAIAAMDDAQLVREKKMLKQGLRGFDIQFEKTHGRVPEKADKEPLRLAYAYYKDLKKELALREADPNSMIAQRGGAGDDDDREPVRFGGGKIEAPRPTEPLTRHGYAAGSGATRPAPDMGRGGSAAEQQPVAQYSNWNDKGGGRARPTAETLPTGPKIPLPGEGHLSAAQIEELRAEKKALKRKLFTFMNEFREKHGREVRTKEDRADCAGEYERYRQLKTFLQDVDSKQQGGAGL